MRVLVYPHDLAIGGSQLNAIEVAAAMRPAGVEPILVGRPGALLGRIEELGLEFVETPDPGRRPSRRVASAVHDLVCSRRVELLHGYEWPPTLELTMAAGLLPRRPVVSTVMSMAVAPFVPHDVHLVVGTEQIAAAERARGRDRVHVIEPPVDLEHNVHPGEDAVAALRARHGLTTDRPLVVVVSRLADQLKLEGLLHAMTLAADLAPTDDAFDLLVVGDGPARERVVAGAEEANRRAERRVVVLAGEMRDPRPAYAAADVCVGMGGSALRALAFAKPLVVQGESGFFLPLSEETTDVFSWQGWYGTGADPELGVAALREALVPLLRDLGLRAERAYLGRRLVERCSVSAAAQDQLRIYEEALASPSRPARHVVDTGRAAGQLARYKVARTSARLLGRAATEDFNSAPVAGRAAGRRAPGDEECGRRDPVLWYAGVAWDAVQGTDRRLAERIADDRDVLWVDPPEPSGRPWRPGSMRARVEHPRPGLTRISTPVLPGVTRPVLRDLALIWSHRSVRRALADLGVTPQVVLASCTEPVLRRHPDLPSVYYATDDVVAAADLWGVSARMLHGWRESNLRAAGTVLAVSGHLARMLRREGTTPRVLPNGHTGAPPPGAAGVDLDLPHPVAAVVGQLNERIDLACLEEVRDHGMGLLVVGPAVFATQAARERFDRLVASPGVRWTGRVPSEELAGYLASSHVGLSPYADTAFNRSCSPLKTLEYLAAGLPVAATAVATDPAGSPFVRQAPDAAGLALRAAELAHAGTGPDEIRRSVAGHDWVSRARALAVELDRAGTGTS
ncbi:glycosyltransferase [Janibacter melonis]|uniref:glycosyltransferase n=1 Tax=Janibacter melonis TaxID=262209 RepID=UPI00177FCE36|nr:glycosyltransferase [Janibacter melonis]